MEVGFSSPGFHQLAWQQVLAQGCRWERPRLRSRKKPLAPSRARSLPFPSRAPRHGPCWGGGAATPSPPAWTARVERRRWQRGRPVPQVPVQHPPEPSSAAHKRGGVAGQAGPTRGAAEQLSPQVRSADWGSGTPEETRGGSQRPEAARLGEPGRRSPPRPSQPSALTPGKDEASPEKAGQVSRGQPCPFRWAPMDTSGRPG